MNKINKKIIDRSHYQLPPAVETKHFKGDEWRLILVKSGGATYQFNDSSFEVETGSLFLLGPNYRRIITASKQAFSIEIIFFNHLSEFSTADFIDFQQRGSSYRLLREMFQEVYSRENEACHDSLFDNLLQLFLRDHKPGTEGDPRILKALEILREQGGYRIESAELARRVGLSRAHFYNLFRVHTGETYAAWVRRKRMHLALTLMQEFGFSSKHVAHEIGSSSAQAFSREFKSFFGSSAKDFLQGK